MTDNEIIKALECCGGSSAVDCYDCPLKQCKMTHCTTELATKALDLINRQKAEIVETRRDLLNEIYALEHQLETAKSEAYKEFERKSKDRLVNLYEKYYKIANKPKKGTDMFYQGRAEAIWECINVNNNLVKELSEVSDNA